LPEQLTAAFGVLSSLAVTSYFDLKKSAAAERSAVSE
jgi:hypothetical protein